MRISLNTAVHMLGAINSFSKEYSVLFKWVEPPKECALEQLITSFLN